MTRAVGREVEARVEAVVVVEVDAEGGIETEFEDSVGRQSTAPVNYSLERRFQQDCRSDKE